MNKPPILCDRCDNNFFCLLDYDGKNCRKTRSIEPTNADKIRAMTDEELAEWGATLPCCPPGPNLNELCSLQKQCENFSFAKQCWLGWLKWEAKE